MLSAEIKRSSKQTHWPIFVNHYKLVAVAELIHLIEVVGNITKSRARKESQIKFLGELAVCILQRSHCQINNRIMVNFRQSIKFVVSRNQEIRLCFESLAW